MCASGEVHFAHHVEGQGVGLDPAYVATTDGLLPGTRFAVDAYVALVRDRSVLEAIASSLTELFSPTIIAERVSGMLANYEFVTEETLAYFTPRLTQAPLHRGHDRPRSR